MSGSATEWLAFAEENLACARLVADSGYLNSAPHNAQQAFEKTLKALIVDKGLEFRKTHSIQQLRGAVSAVGIETELSDEECELLDSVYLPSKYPLGSALPDVHPDRATCDSCIAIAGKVLSLAKQLVETTTGRGDENEQLPNLRDTD
jgi:HEPN domain-containing protein